MWCRHASRYTLSRRRIAVRGRRYIQQSTASSKEASEFASTASAESSQYQIFISTTQDPYLNLSIEHHLLQTTPASSTVLFLYANRPCVVIGRNQNPWLETNLRLLSLPSTSFVPSTSAAGRSEVHNDVVSSLEHVELVRRRSGGGTVFHGPGNVNYSVICPSESFTRDKHARMIASALQAMNPSAHVNSRHDIVIAAPPPTDATPPTHRQEEHPAEGSPSNPSSAAVAASLQPNYYKISGSAFKLTRGRALHHGTCLLCTPHLTALSGLLTSPARGFLEARGVESVRSPVANLLPAATKAETLSRHTHRFYDLVLHAFADLYPAASLAEPHVQSLMMKNAADHGSAPKTEIISIHGNTIAGLLGSNLASLPSIRDGMAELRSEAWLFGQTPRFTLKSSEPAENLAQSIDAMSPPGTPAAAAVPTLSDDISLALTARNGVVDGTVLRSRDAGAHPGSASLSLDDLLSTQDAPRPGSLGAALKGKTLWTMSEQDWADAMRKVTVLDNGIVRDSSIVPEDVQRRLATWFSAMLALPQRPAR